MRVFAGEPNAVHDLETDIFGDLGPHAVACIEAISARESTDTWWAYNPSTATGLTQIKNPMHADVAITATGSSDLMNPYVNLVTARAMSANGTNWDPWNPWPAACR